MNTSIINPDQPRVSGADTTNPYLAPAVRRAAWRIVPFVGLGYFVSSLDRTSAAYAGLQMNQDLGLSATQFGLAGSILYVAYTLFEVPSNLALAHFGARRWLARILITWGIAASANALVTGASSFYVARFLVGAFEAGFFPGAVFLLSLWFPAQYRTRMLALFAVAGPVSQFLGAPISVGLLQLDGFLGFTGWRWMFFVEGLPAVILGIAALWVLADSPEKARWLPGPEREALAAALAHEHLDRAHSHVLSSFADIRVWILCGITFCFTIGSTGGSLWLPLILKGHNLSNVVVGLLSMIPFFAATVATLAWAVYVDRTGKRIYSLLWALSLGLAGLLLSTRFASLLPSLLFLTCALAGIIAARTIFYTIPQVFLTGAAAAAGLALINSVGSIGGIVGPVMVGWLKDWSGGYEAGLAGMAVIMLAGIGLTILLKRHVRSQ